MLGIREALKVEAEIKESLLDQVIRLQSERDQMKTILIEIAEWDNDDISYQHVKKMAQKTLANLGIPFNKE